LNLIGAREYPTVEKRFDLDPVPIEPEPITEPQTEPEPEPETEPHIGTPGEPSTGPSTSPGNQIGVSSYEPPASYGVFPAKGQQVNDDLGRAIGTNSDNDQSYSTKIGKYKVLADEEKDLFSVDGEKTGKNLKVPFGVVGLKDNNEWMLRLIEGPDDNIDDPVSAVYHSKDQQAIVVTDTFNENLGPGFLKADIIPHSELTFQGWKAAPGGQIQDLKYVVVAQIQNKDTPKLIDDARASVAGSQTAGTEVTFMAVSQNTAEQQGFYALAGSENGKFVFRMLADHQSDFQGLKVVAAHTWAQLPDSDDPVLIWELGH
jgi:hypothetical protein